MWPVPDSIDKARIFNAAPLDKDVDGIHFASWGSKYPPVTPAAAMELIQSHNVAVSGKQVSVFYGVSTLVIACNVTCSIMGCCIK